MIGLHAATPVLLLLTSFFSPIIEGQSVSASANQSLPADSSVFGDADCGITKGCWFEPSGCSQPNSNGSSSDNGCLYMVSWTSDSDGLLIQLGANVSLLQADSPRLGKYIALGFSYDDKMGDDSVAECVIAPDGRIRSFVSFNDHTFNAQLKQTSTAMLSGSGGSLKDGFLSCQFRRRWAATDNIPESDVFKVFDLTAGKWILQIAIGNADPESFTKHMHWLGDGDLFPMVTTQYVDMTQSAPYPVLTNGKHYDIPRSIQYQLVMAHGVLLLLGWWIFGTFSFFIARYFKTMWPHKKLFGTKIWYQLHRDVIVVGLVLQCAGFALVYIQAGDWKMCSHACGSDDYALKLHTVLGVACTAAAVVQPFIAWIRPGPEDRKRPIFNWVHWFLGMGSWILATVTIFLSAPLGKSGLRRNHRFIPDYLMAGYVCSYIAASVVLEILVQLSEKHMAHINLRNNKIGLTENSIPMTAVSGPISSSTKHAKTDTNTGM